jgi:hypothetical protein
VRIHFNYLIKKWPWWKLSMKGWPWLDMGARLRGKEGGREERGKGGAAGWLGGRGPGGRHGESCAWSSARSSLFREFCGHEVLAMRRELLGGREPRKRREQRKTRKEREKEKEGKMGKFSKPKNFHREK